MEPFPLSPSDFPTTSLSAGSGLFEDSWLDQLSLPGPGAVVTSPELRCLDEKHGTSCRQCHPAPPWQEAASWELVGDPGLRNGERKLRTLLTRTREWGSSDEREAAATQLQGALPRLASALRSRYASALSKETMLALVHLWGYRAENWRRRGNRPTRKECKGARATEAAAETAPAPVPSNAERVFELKKSLRTLFAATQQGIVGPRAQALAQNDAEARALFAREVETHRRLVAHYRAWQPKLHALASQAARAHDAGGVAPDAAFSPEQLALQITQYGIRSATSIAEQNRQQLVSSSWLCPQHCITHHSPLRSPQADPGCSEAERVWRSETLAGEEAHLEGIKLVHDFVVRTPAEERATAAVFALEVSVLHISGVLGSNVERLAWLEALPPAEGAPPGRLTEGIEAVLHLFPLLSRVGPGESTSLKVARQVGETNAQLY